MVSSNFFKALFLFMAMLLLATSVQAQNSTNVTSPPPTHSGYTDIPSPPPSHSSANTLSSTVALFGALIAVGYTFLVLPFERETNPSFLGCDVLTIIPGRDSSARERRNGNHHTVTRKLTHNEEKKKETSKVPHTLTHFRRFYSNPGVSYPAAS